MLAKFELGIEENGSLYIEISNIDIDELRKLLDTTSLPKQDTNIICYITRLVQGRLKELYYEVADATLAL